MTTFTTKEGTQLYYNVTSFNGPVEDQHFI
jgi:hypothetical protein